MKDKKIVLIMIIIVIIIIGIIIALININSSTERQKLEEEVKTQIYDENDLFKFEIVDLVESVKSKIKNMDDFVAKIKDHIAYKMYYISDTITLNYDEYKEQDGIVKIKFTVQGCDHTTLIATIDSKNNTYEFSDY